MHEMKAKVDRICKMKDRLMDIMEQEMSKSSEDICTEESGEVIDMIKDLAEAEEKCWKACYYHKILEAMEEEKDFLKDISKMQAMGVMSMGNDRAGYDRWRRSDGEYAPKGEGHLSPVHASARAGFIPEDMMRWPYPGPRYPHEPPYMARMGYVAPNPDTMDVRSPDAMSRRDRWQDARRHYSQTGSEEDRSKMTAEAKECVSESIETMRDIWAEADPHLQEKMRKDLLNLMREMGM